mmetsp:Transcript_73601/g.204547  ORF Transcript_73601/g.204547 Transcript_73601/m.204547 type:complete len:230 (-) Transcript_73601:10-699(-)
MAVSYPPIRHLLHGDKPVTCQVPHKVHVTTVARGVLQLADHLKVLLFPWLDLTLVKELVERECPFRRCSIKWSAGCGFPRRVTGRHRRRRTRFGCLHVLRRVASLGDIPSCVYVPRAGVRRLLCTVYFLPLLLVEGKPRRQNVGWEKRKKRSPANSEVVHAQLRPPWACNARLAPLMSFPATLATLATEVLPLRASSRLEPTGKRRIPPFAPERPPRSRLSIRPTERAP